MWLCLALLAASTSLLSLALLVKWILPESAPQRDETEELLNGVTRMMHEGNAYAERMEFERRMAYLQQRNLEAEQKSENLFKDICGKEAHVLLSQIGVMRIVGSLGTEYYLRNERNYCVERASDRLRLCAVIPDVPLWDQLLGLKLMIENDEPAFLRVAHNILQPGFAVV